jgi:hypothetical protein
MRIKAKNEFGHILVTDMEVPKTEHRERLVDPRTLEFLILRNVKYVVK